MKDDVSPPIDAAKRRFSFSASTRDAAASNRVTPSSPGGDGDPTVGGGVLRIYNAAGLAPDDVTITLPATGWQAIGSGASFKGYRYTAPSTAPVRRIIVKGDKITIRGGRAQFAYTLNEVRQGQVAVVLRLGTELGWCASAPAKPRGPIASTADSDKPGRFVGAPKTPAPATCPAPPSAGSPSGAFVDRS